MPSDVVLAFMGSVVVGLDLLSLYWLWDLRGGEARDDKARKEAKAAHERISKHHGMKHK